MANEKLSEVVVRYKCEMCDYKCGNKTNYDKHLSTNKHANNVTANNNANIGDNITNNRVYTCQNCNNVYAHQSSLCKHIKTCKHRENIQTTIGSDISTVKPINQSLIHTLLNDNKELRNLLVEQAKEYMNFINQQNTEHRKETSDILNRRRFETERPLGALFQITGGI
jgi:hypothetical protein